MIGGWALPPVIMYGTEEQQQRWIPATLHGDISWCQLFSEPGAGSDLAALATRADAGRGRMDPERPEGLDVDGQAGRLGHPARRTNPDAPKHDGISCFMLDMHTPGDRHPPAARAHRRRGVQRGVLRRRVHPRRLPRRPGRRRLDRRPRHARQRARRDGRRPGWHVGARLGAVGLYDAHPERLEGGAARIGSYTARQLAMGLLNLRSANRVVAGSEPGPEGAITKWRCRRSATTPPTSCVTSPDPTPLHGRHRRDEQHARAVPSRACRSPAAPPRSSATRSASASSDSPTSPSSSDRRAVASAPTSLRNSFAFAHSSRTVRPECANG